MTSIAFSPDGDLLAVAGRAGVVLMNLSDPVPVPIWAAGYSSAAGASSIEFSPDGERVAIAGDPFSGALICDVATGDKLRDFNWDQTSGDLVVWPPDEVDTRTESIEWISYSPGGTFLAVSGAKRGDDTKAVKVVDLESETQVATFDDLYGPVSFSPDGEFIAVGGYNGLYLLDPATSERQLSFDRDTGVLSLDWSPAGRALVTGSTDGTVELWDSDTGRRLWSTRVGGPW